MIVEGWGIRFLPVARALDEEAIASAEEIDLHPGDEKSVKTRILRPEHLVANCLLVGRPKDQTRIMQFLTEHAVNIEALCGVITRRGLRHKWQEFCGNMHIGDPCGA